MLSLELCRCPSDGIFLSSESRSMLLATAFIMVQARLVSVKNTHTKYQVYTPTRKHAIDGRVMLPCRSATSSLHAVQPFFPLKPGDNFPR